MSRPPHVLTSLLLVTSALILTACGGLYTSQSGTGDSTRDGLRFSSRNPTTATPGSTVELAYDVVAASPGEANTDVTVNLSATGGASVTPTSSTVRIPGGSEGATRVIRVQVPQEAAPGSEIMVTLGRESVRSVSYRLTVASTGFVASIAPASVQAPQGGNAAGTLTLTPVGGFSGDIQLTGLDPDVVLTSRTMNIPAGSTTPVSTDVTYRVSSGAPAGVPILAMVRAVSGDRSALASFTVTPTANQGQGTFTLGVTPQTVNIVGGQPTSGVTVTITPLNGFQGNVAVNVSLPGQGSLTVAPPDSNPFTLTVTDGPVTKTFQLRYTPGQGGAPIGTATVQATGNGVNRTANFTVGAS